MTAADLIAAWKSSPEYEARTDDFLSTMSPPQIAGYLIEKAKVDTPLIAPIDAAVHWAAGYCVESHVKDRNSLWREVMRLLMEAEGV